MSLWQTPQACTFMRTCPRVGFGMTRSTISKSPPSLEICAAFIGAIPTFVVAIIPPLNLQLSETGSSSSVHLNQGHGELPFFTGPKLLLDNRKTIHFECHRPCLVNLPPNMGSPLFDSALGASSWSTSQCPRTTPP